MTFPNNDVRHRPEPRCRIFGVILALISATITLTVRRRWLLEELRAFERAREEKL